MRSWKFCSFKLLRYSGKPSGILGCVLAFWEMRLVSGKCFDASGNGLDPFVIRGCCRSLGSISWFWKVFWTLGLLRYSWNLGVCVFSFWQVFCYLREVFWLLGSVLVEILRGIAFRIQGSVLSQAAISLHEENERRYIDTLVHKIQI